MQEDQPLVELLASYKPFDELEALHIRQLVQFLSMGNNHYDRTNLLGHVVADAWIVNPERNKVVLIEHGLNKLWMAPGGHCDGDTDVLAPARREVWEETGLADITPLLDGGIYDINVGVVPTREKNGTLEPSHIHFDICFAFEASEHVPLKISLESTGLAWVLLEDFPALNTSPSHNRRLLKTQRSILK